MNFVNPLRNYVNGRWLDVLKDVYFIHKIWNDSSFEEYIASPMLNNDDSHHHSVKSSTLTWFLFLWNMVRYGIFEEIRIDEWWLKASPATCSSSKSTQSENETKRFWKSRTPSIRLTHHTKLLELNRMYSIRNSKESVHAMPCIMSNMILMDWWNRM